MRFPFHLTKKTFQPDVKPRERKPLFRWRVVLAIAVLYFAVIALTPLPDRLMLFPTTDRINAAPAVRKPIPFEGGELEIWTAASKLAQQRGEPLIYILRFYGNADRADRWVADEAEMWNNRAVEVWGMNYPGFGGSTGPARLKRLGPAALAAFSSYTTRPPCGRSFSASSAGGIYGCWPDRSPKNCPLIWTASRTPRPFTRAQFSFSRKKM